VKTTSAARATSAALAQRRADVAAIASGTRLRVAGFGEVQRHRRAHDAEADESDVHGGSLG
jgi:hypothetical protein